MWKSVFYDTEEEAQGRVDGNCEVVSLVRGPFPVVLVDGETDKQFYGWEVRVRMWGLD